MTMPLGRAAMALSLLLLAWTGAVVAAGRIDLRDVGLPIVARTPWPTALGAAVLLAAAAAFRRGACARDLEWVLRQVRRHGVPLALGLAVTTAALAIRYGAFVAGGSDSYCYVEQAERLAAGTLREPVFLGLEPTWPNAALSLAPTGFVPSQVVPGAIAPICPAGLALAMAAPRVLGAPPPSVFYVVPLLAGLAVWAAFLVGRRLAGPGAGLATALLTAASPVFLYQAAQPMSDVPATAWWLVALALAGRRTRPARLATGAAAGVAVLMRPNLAPLVGLLVAYAALRLEGEPVGTLPRLGRMVMVTAGAVPAALCVALVQWVVYGSPLRSGYGSLEALFKLAHVAPNLERYVPWLLQTQSPLILASLVTPVAMWRWGGRRDAWYATLVAGFAAGIIAAYLPYVPFEDWWFLRFWLPALPALIALAVSLPALMCRAGARAMTPGEASTAATFAGAMAVVATVALAGWQAGVARDRGAFALADSERKFVSVGEYVRTALPQDAVVLTIWHSGSVRYYGQRPSVVWDAFSAEQWPAVVEALEHQGREPFLLLEDWEREAFRARFGGLDVAALDWPPRARIGRSVSIWAIGDRAPFLRGDAVRSDRVW